MAAAVRTPLSELLRKAEAEPEMYGLLEGVRGLAEALMVLEVEQHPSRRHERTAERAVQRVARAGLDTRVSTHVLRGPRVQDGNSFPGC